MISFARCTALVALAWLLVVVPVAARELPTTRPERMGMSSERLERLTRAHVRTGSWWVGSG